jgi:Mce-associated membrane protein
VKHRLANRLDRHRGTASTTPRDPDQPQNLPTELPQAAEAPSPRPSSDTAAVDDTAGPVKTLTHDTVESAAHETGATGENDTPQRSIRRWQQALVFVVLPALAVLLAGGASYLKWVQGRSQTAAAAVAAQSVASAADATVAMLSYKPDTVAKDLNSARERLTGAFKDSYTSLTRDVVIPGSQQKQISATATVPAAASVSTTENHSVVLIFVNQTVIVGHDAPSDTASTVRVTLDRVDGRWLISGFEPI